MQNNNFTDDYPEVCDICNSWIWAGHRMFYWKTYSCCSIECMKQAMFEKLQTEVVEKPILTADQKEIRYGNQNRSRK